MTSIRLRFVTSGGSAVSKMIQFSQYGFWASHVEAVMPEGTLLGAHFAGGVMNRPADYDAGAFTQEEFVDLPATEEVRDRFHAMMRAEVGKPYDVTAIAAFVARRDWREDDSWFCSELVMAMLDRAGWFPGRVATEANHLTPRDARLIISGIVPAKTEETR